MTPPVAQHEWHTVMKNDHRRIGILGGLGSLIGMVLGVGIAWGFLSHQVASVEKVQEAHHVEIKANADNVQYLREAAAGTRAELKGLRENDSRQDRRLESLESIVGQGLGGDASLILSRPDDAEMHLVASPRGGYERWIESGQ